MKQINQKGFTLIELLVVIAVLGVLAAALVSAINPTSKINAAKDSNAKSDLSQVVNAAQAYVTNSANNSLYPAGSADFTVAGGELKTFPATITYVANAGKTAAAAYALSAVDATKYICWDSTLSAIKTTTTTAPTATTPTCN